MTKSASSKAAYQNEEKFKMIKSVYLKNFGPIKTLEWDKIGIMNLLIGGNATGKTFLLKALYVMLRASEDFGVGDDPRKFEEVLADKLYWTFQVDKFNDLLTKGAAGRLELIMKADHGAGSFSLGEKTVNTITEFKNNFQKRDDRSIFIPAKEVISLIKIIINSREQLKSFGFDDTYYDLAKALNIPIQKGKNYKTFSDARAALESIINGKLNYDADTGRWSLRKGRLNYSINVTAEGAKKIAIMDNLLGNRYLTPRSVLFIDEPESSLHPEALNKFLDILFSIAREGIQIFIASHSYFTIKKLLIISQKEKLCLPVLSLSEDGIVKEDMKNGMPDNAIIRESIRLYKEEIEASFV
jgi:AAA15 family ATPase/GTPase